jgi:hypothetical protein
MSYSSELQERRRRNRRQNTRLLIYVVRSLLTTAALVAIAFAFDVPERIRAKLWGPPHEAAALQPTENSTTRRPPVQRQTAEAPATVVEPPDRINDLPRRSSTPKEQIALQSKPTTSPGKDEVVIPHRPRPAVLAPNGKPPVVPEADKDESIGQYSVLKLVKKQMRIPIVEAPAEGNSTPRVRVIALREVEAKVELQPADGIVGDDELQIVFPDCPRARILVRVDKIGQRIFLVIEPQMALWADQPMPYTLKKIKSEAHKTRQAAEEFFVRLAAAEEEKASLEAWIQPGTGIKPLADVQRANKRIAVLKALIEQMNGQVEAVKLGVEQVDELQRLADLLHDQAKLQFETVDAD